MSNPAHERTRAYIASDNRDPWLTFIPVEISWLALAWRFALVLVAIALSAWQRPRSRQRVAFRRVAGKRSVDFGRPCPAVAICRTYGIWSSLMLLCHRSGVLRRGTSGARGNRPCAPENYLRNCNSGWVCADIAYVTTVVVQSHRGYNRAT